MTRVILAITSAALAVSSTAASATRHILIDGHDRAFVTYHDLDLQSQSGRSSLTKRIRRAADMVCTDNSNLMPFSDLSGRCYREAVQSGISQMDQIASR